MDFQIDKNWHFLNESYKVIKVSYSRIIKTCFYSILLCCNYCYKNKSSTIVSLKLFQLIKTAFKWNSIFMLVTTISFYCIFLFIASFYLFIGYTMKRDPLCIISYVLLWLLCQHWNYLRLMLASWQKQEIHFHWSVKWPYSNFRTFCVYYYYHVLCLCNLQFWY